MVGIEPGFKENKYKHAIEYECRCPNGQLNFKPQMNN